MSETLKYLMNRWNEHKFPHALHIYSENVEEALNEVKNFAARLYSQYIKVPLENNTDFMIISNESLEKEQSKFISVDQIRSMQGFLNKSSSLSPFKIVIIYKAEMMNNNAFNSCLKVLEEPPLGSYIFLITSLTAKLPATILSRCSKLYINSKVDGSNGVINKQIIDLLNNPSSEQRESLIGKLSLKKDNDLWRQFSESSLCILNSICKIKAGIKLDLDQAIFHRIAARKTMPYLISCYDAIKDILNKTFEQDLDRRQAAIMVTTKFLTLIR
ncbi:MAG: polymerase subunit delta [Rickettsiaceae bacterium]|jgi:DNA polymerase-3 subunit delta'|nr:polymerase subunit delta [Rickettsiaceae bacterium]